jgi:hypothetical protein
VLLWCAARVLALAPDVSYYYQQLQTGDDGCRSVTRGVTWGQNAVFSGNENQGTARRALSRAFRNWSYFYCARPWERARRAQSSEKGNFEAPKRVVGGAQLPVCWLCVGKLGRGFTLVPFFYSSRGNPGPKLGGARPHFGAEIPAGIFPVRSFRLFTRLRDKWEKVPRRAPEAPPGYSVFIRCT